MDIWLPLIGVIIELYPADSFSVELNINESIDKIIENEDFNAVVKFSDEDSGVNFDEPIYPNAFED